MSSAGTTLRGQIERLLHGRTGRGLSLDYLCEQLPDASREAVRNSLKYLVKLGLAMRHGTTRHPIYQSVRPNGSLGADLKVRTAAAESMATRDVQWPDDVKVQHVGTLQRLRGPWRGIDWSQAVQRPGCQDHLAVPSRRGDVRVPHRPAAGMRSSREG